MSKRHILFIDPLEKLTISKDSSLMLALSMKERGIEVYLTFEKNFYCSNSNSSSMSVFDFKGGFKDDGIYLQDFNLESEKVIELEKGDTFHMRLDPPFDSRYLRYLWMLKMWQKKGVVVINSPEGILNYNEKLYAYEQEESLHSFVGSSVSMFKNFLSEMKKESVDYLILKPLDLYQGIGVEKIKVDELSVQQFEKKVEEFQGPIVAQPFVKDVEKGEIRSLYYNGIELGSILKTPPKGEFLANIAQGASYEKVSLNDVQKRACERICSELMDKGVPWVAFDILGDFISEVNITCPGLLVEVSKAHGKNLGNEIIRSLTRVS